MRGCLTLILFVGSVGTAIAYAGVWALILVIAVIAWLVLVCIGKLLVMLGRGLKGDEIGEWQVLERCDQSIRESDPSN